MKNKHKGPIASYITQHLKLRRSLGYLYKGAEFTLNAFDHFLSLNYPNCNVITRQMIVGYLKTTQHKMPATRSDHVSDLRQFCRFMLQFDTKTYIPEKGLVEPAVTQVKPYIFTEGDIKEIIKQAMKLHSKDGLLPHTYHVIIGLLWVTGMRIGEVIRLKIADLDLVENLLYIRQSKFFKSRVIPLQPSTVQTFNDYLKRRAHCGYPNKPETSVFINNRGKPCTIATTPKTLRTLMKRAEIKTHQHRTPRVHDLRHSFATRWLMDIYKAKKDPNIYLPVLATYLGHASIANTQVYLHPSLELLGIAGDKLHSYIQLNQGGNDEKT